MEGLTKRSTYCRILTENQSLPTAKIMSRIILIALALCATSFVVPTLAGKSPTPYEVSNLDKLLNIASIGLHSDSDKWSCDVCQGLMITVSSSLTPELIQKIREAAINGCANFNDEERKMCEEQVDKAIELIQRLIKETPRQACEDIGACEKPRNWSKLAAMGIASIRHEQEMEKMFAKLSEQFWPNVRDIAGCETCELVTREIQVAIKDGRAVKLVQNTMDQVCRTIHRSNQTAIDLCHEVTSAYLMEAVKFISEQTPEEFCTMLGICNSAKYVGCKKVCEVCTTAFDKLKEVVAVKDNVDKVKVYMAELCQLIWKTEPEKASNCSEELRTAVDDMVGAVLKTNSFDLCRAYHLCLKSE